MLVGTGRVADFEKDAPTLERLDAEPLRLAGAEVLQVLCEMDHASMCEMLPPALHPTLPPVVTWTGFRFPETEWGELRLAQTRIECRSGLRPRGLLVSAVVDEPAAARALASRFGFRCRLGKIDLRRGYDETRLRVEIDDEPILELALRSPERLGNGDVQFVSSLHPAHTPRGFRLVQLDAGYDVERAERGELVLDAFDATAWGEPRLVPAYPISAAVCVADVTFRSLRFLCRPDVMAFEGTEAV
jgi:hypothetical protein